MEDVTETNSAARTHFLLKVQYKESHY